MLVILGLLLRPDANDDLTSAPPATVPPDGPETTQEPEPTSAPSTVASDAPETTQEPESTSAPPALEVSLTYTGHTDSVPSVAQLDNGNIASASNDSTVQIWDPNNR